MRRLLFLMCACLVALAVMLPVAATDAEADFVGPVVDETVIAEQEPSEEGSAAEEPEKPAWQVFVEQEIVPGVIFILSCAGMVYIAISPLMARMRRASDKYSAAADDVNLVSGHAKENTVEVKQLRVEMDVFKNELRAEISALLTADQKKIAELKAEQSAREDKLQGLLETGVKMMSLAFSHESELVKNGTAREIMKVVEENEGKEL